MYLDLPNHTGHYYEILFVIIFPLILPGWLVVGLLPSYLPPWFLPSVVGWWHIGLLPPSLSLQVVVGKPSWPPSSSCVFRFLPGGIQVALRPPYSLLYLTISLGWLSGGLLGPLPSSRCFRFLHRHLAVFQSVLEFPSRSEADRDQNWVGSAPSPYWCPHATVRVPEGCPSSAL